jgi:hypothetical protein
VEHTPSRLSRKKVKDANDMHLSSTPGDPDIKADKKTTAPKSRHSSGLIKELQEQARLKAIEDWTVKNLGDHIFVTIQARGSSS